MIKVKVFAVNVFREATYVVSDETGECVVIDCGVSNQTERERLVDYIERNNLRPVLAINTHCHVDHILGVNFLKQRYNVDFVASSLDADILESAPAHAQMYSMQVEGDMVNSIDKDISSMDKITFGNTSFDIVPTPGHSKGGVCLFEKESGTLFTGDTIFKGSIGRTDLPGGDYKELMTSILEKIVPLGKDITIYPGHGDHTTLSDELMYNPFITDVLTGQVNYK